MRHLLFLVVFMCLPGVIYAQSSVDSEIYSKKQFFTSYPSLTVEDYEKYKVIKRTFLDKETEDIVRSLFNDKLPPVKEVEGPAKVTEEIVEESKEKEDRDKKKKRREYIKRKKDQAANPILNPEEKGTLNKKKKLDDRSYKYKRVKSKYKSVSEKKRMRRDENYGPKRVDEEGLTTPSSSRQRNTRILGK